MKSITVDQKQRGKLQIMGDFFRYELLLTKKTGNETGIKSIVSSKVTLFYEVIHTQDIWVRFKGPFCRGS
jgi:hypothetical protein